MITNYNSEVIKEPVKDLDYPELPKLYLSNQVY